MSAGRRLLRTPFANPAAWALAFVVSLAVSGCAQLEASRKVKSLDAEALRDVERGRPHEARKKLVQALAAAKEAGLEKDEATARTRLHLGAIYAGLLGQRGKGVDQMALALEIKSDLKLPPALAKPKALRAYATARKRARKTPTIEQALAAAKSPAKPVERAADEPREPKAAKKVAKESPRTEPPRPEPPPPPKPAAPLPRAAPPPPKVVASDEEPDLPASIPQAVYCPVPDEVPPGAEVSVWCVIRSDVPARTAALYYRSRGQEDFTRAAMTKTSKGWYTGEIPADAVDGKTVQYYVEALGTGEKLMAATGDFRSPNLLLLRAGAPAVRRGALMAAYASTDDGPEPAGEDENPLAAVGQDEPALNAEAEPRVGPRFWVGLGAGTGYGWHAAGPLEYRPDLRVDGGLASSGLLHVLPEVGWEVRDTFALSLQSRHQFIPAEGTQGGRPGRPARGAHAILLRALWFPFGTVVRPFLSGAIGGGEGFRLRFAPNTIASQPGTDTVRGGPVVFGPGAGLVVRIGDRFGLTLETRLLVGAPDFAAIGEAGLGFLARF